MSLNEMGKRISELRLSAKLTQRELGEKLTVSEKTVSKWETGTGMPDLPMIPRLSDVLGVSTDYLFGREEQSTPDDRLRAAVDAAIDVRIGNIADAVAEKLADKVSAAVEDVLIGSGVIENAIDSALEWQPAFGTDFGTIVLNREKTVIATCLSARIMELTGNAPVFNIVATVSPGETTLLASYQSIDEATADLHKIAQAIAGKQRYLEL